MMLTRYTYADPPERLAQPAADGRIRLRLTLYTHRGGHFTVVTDPQIGLSENEVMLMSRAPAVRGQLIGHPLETIILGARPDFSSVATPDPARVEAMAEAGKADLVADALKAAHARIDALVASMKQCARMLEGAPVGDVPLVARQVAGKLRRDSQ